MHLNKTKNKKRHQTWIYMLGFFFGAPQSELSLRTGDQEMFVDFDRLSSAVWVSVLIVHWLSLLARSRSSVPFFFLIYKKEQEYCPLPNWEFVGRVYIRVHPASEIKGKAEAGDYCNKPLQPVNSPINLCLIRVLPFQRCRLRSSITRITWFHTHHITFTFSPSNRTSVCTTPLSPQAYGKGFRVQHRIFPRWWF